MTSLLLDTHTLIWALENNPTLSEAARSAIIDGRNTVFVSAVSVWEISIKRALGKLDVPDNLLEEIEAHRFTPLEISLQHGEAAGKLPAIHQDPFDRMLIAQAQLEGLVLVTRDQHIPKYAVQCLPA